MPGQFWIRGLAVVMMELLAVSPAAADAAADMVSANDIASVTRALTAVGHQAAIRQDDDGARYILVDEGEEEFSVDFGDCDDETTATGCKLLIFNALWEADTPFDSDIVNRFNQTATLAHAYIADDGALDLTLSVITGDGLPAETFAEIIAVWRESDAALAELIDTDAEPPAATVIAALRLP